MYQKGIKIAFINFQHWIPNQNLRDGGIRILSFLILPKLGYYGHQQICLEGRTGLLAPAMSLKNLRVGLTDAAKELE